MIRAFSIAIALCLVGAALPGTVRADSDVTRPETLDLRARFHDFLRLAQVKQWAMEDKLLAGERAFGDEQRKALRDLDVKIADDTGSSSEDWRKARQHAQERRREAVAESRQKTKIHREQVELELIVFERDRKTEFKGFLASIENDLTEFKRNQNVAVKNHQGTSNEALIDRALEDVHAAGEDLSGQLSPWSDRLKSIKTREEME